jgi:hypothetical protein
VRISGVVFSVVIAAASASHADEAKPWAAGVVESEQAAALSIYREGNSEFEESRYPQALAKYRQALAHWDHPAIRFNMAVALINLDQPLEAHEHLEKAMRFGAAPLGAEGYAQAVTYKKLLDGQLAHLRVRCGVDGADVTLDGKPLVKCPGEAERLLMPGDHHLVATKPGFQAESTALVLVPGKEHVHDVALSAVGTKLVRRWSANRPWIVVGIGAGAALLGTVFELQSRSDYKSYDDLVLSQCPLGCPPDMPVSDSLQSKARVENIAGMSLLVTGGAVVIAGLVGVYLNAPHAIAEHTPVITPVASRGGGGALATWSW